MKTSYPYYRVVQYTSDGCTEYQCLACKAKWEARSSGKSYCGSCGTKFLGQHESNERKIEKYPEKYNPDAPRRAWVLQTRQYDLTPDWVEYLRQQEKDDWRNIVILRGFPAPEALRVLKSYRRAEELCWADPDEKFALLRHEFRLVRQIVKDSDDTYCHAERNVPSPTTWHD